MSKTRPVAKFYAVHSVVRFELIRKLIETDVAVFRRAEQAFGAKGAIEWLTSPAHGFGGRIPSVVASTKKGAARVSNLIDQIDRGTAL